VVYENRQNDTWLEDLEPTKDLMIAIACETKYGLSTVQSRFSQLS
jgi:hypothetical protein